QDYALATLADLQLVLLQISTGISMRRVPDAMRNVDHINLSPSGKSAVVHSSASNRMQVLSGLPDQPLVSWGTALAFLPGSVTALIVSDDARFVLAAFSHGETGSLFLLDRAGVRSVSVPGVVSS